LNLNEFDPRISNPRDNLQYKDCLLENETFIREHYLDTKELSQHLLHLLAVKYPTKV
jgi:hypothetical protein